MSVARNDLSALERLPEILPDDLGCDVLPDFVQHVQLPSENFLIRQTEKMGLLVSPLFPSGWEERRTRGEDRQDPAAKRSMRGTDRTKQSRRGLVSNNHISFSIGLVGESNGTYERCGQRRCLPRGLRE